MQFSLALHLSSLAPDFAYKVAENAIENTHVNIGFVETSGNNIKMKLKLDLGDGEKEYYLERKRGGHWHKDSDGNQEAGYETKEEALEASDEDVTEEEKELAYSDINAALDAFEEKVKDAYEKNGNQKLVAGDLFFTTTDNKYDDKYLTNIDQAQADDQIETYYYSINNEYIKELQQILLDYEDEDGNAYAEETYDDETGSVGVNVSDSIENDVKNIVKTYFKLNPIQYATRDDKFYMAAYTEEVPVIQITRPDGDTGIYDNFDDLFKNTIDVPDNSMYDIFDGGKHYYTDDLTADNKYAAYTYHVTVKDDNILADFGWNEDERSTNEEEWNFQNNFYTIYYNANIDTWYDIAFKGYTYNCHIDFFTYLIDYWIKHFPIRTYYRLIDENGDAVDFSELKYNGYCYTVDDGSYWQNDEGWFWRKSIPLPIYNAIMKKEGYSVINDGSEANTARVTEVQQLLDEAYNTNTDNFTRYVPIVLNVDGHWYENLDYKGAYEWATDETHKINKYVYTAKSDDDDGVKEASKANIIYIEETTKGSIVQIGDPKVEKTNFLNLLLEDEYYRYNGVNKSEEKEKIDFKDTAVDAIAMLEQIQGQNAQMIIRMFKEFMATQGIKFEETTQTALKKQLFSKVIKGYTGELLTDGEFDSVYRAEIPPTQTGFSEGLTVQSPVKGKVTFRTDDSVCILIDAPGENFDQYTILISGFKVDSNIKANETELSEGTKIGETIRQDLKLVLRDENGAVVKNEYITTDENGNMVSGSGINSNITSEAVGKRTEADLDKAIASYNNSVAQQNWKDCKEELLKLQEDYNIDPLFAMAVTIQESSGGSVNTGLVTEAHNWFSVKGSGYSYNGAEWNKYESFGEAVLDFGRLINGSNYFGAGKYTISAIGPTYCNQEWANKVAEHYQNLKDALK